jgi:hypothetical protein
MSSRCAKTIEGAAGFFSPCYIQYRCTIRKSGATFPNSTPVLNITRGKKTGRPFDGLSTTGTHHLLVHI